jgi:hypothetical protein
VEPGRNDTPRLGERDQQGGSRLRVQFWVGLRRRSGDGSLDARDPAPDRT